MRLTSIAASALSVALVIVVGGCGNDAKEGAEAPLQPVAYFAYSPDFEGRVQLSDEMAATLVEIIARKPKPFKRTMKVAPFGYIQVGGKTYAYYGFLASDPQEGDAWDDPALREFWDELWGLGDDIGLLRDFKPSR